MPSAGIPIRVDKPAPTRAIIPALEVIQLSLYGAYLAARAKTSGKKLKITGLNQPIFIVPGEVLTSPGFLDIRIFHSICQ